MGSSILHFIKIKRKPYLELGMILVLLACLSSGCDSQAQESSPSWVTAVAEGDRLQQRVYASKVSGCQVSYHIYTPEEYDSDKQRRFPVIYWLHGLNGGVKWVPRILAYYTQAMRAGNIPPTIIVFPNGMNESMWVDSADGTFPVESILIGELIPEVDRLYRTIPSRRGRLVEGFSMGGYGAARLGLKYAGLFGAVSILGAGPLQTNFMSGPRKNKSDRARILKEVYGNSPDKFREMSPWELATKNAVQILAKKLALRVIIGAKDRALEANKNFSNHLNELGIPHDFQVIPNVGHSAPKLLEAIGDTNWFFYQSNLGGPLECRMAPDLQNAGKQSNTPAISQERQFQSAPSDRDEARRRMMQRMRNFDNNGDSYVTIDEVNQNAYRIFYAIDQDNDGKLSKDEMNYFEQYGLKR